MKKNKFLIVLSVLFVLAVAFYSAKGLIGTGKKISTRPAVAKKMVKKTAKPLPRQAAVKMAIILDDWGPSTALVDEAVAIGRPLTLAILPNLKHSRDIAEAAKARGLSVMLHMPMQPQGKRQPAEPHTILTTSSEAEILKYLEEALASVPYAAGVNNHQGSAATSDERVMRTVLSYLKKKGLFFVDSRVIATSVGRTMADALGVRFAQRDVFIDNVATVDEVKKQLVQAGRLALRRGKVVVIGHDKGPTLEAIRQMVPELERSGVKLVLVKELLE